MIIKGVYCKSKQLKKLIYPKSVNTKYIVSNDNTKAKVWK